MPQQSKGSDRRVFPRLHAEVPIEIIRETTLAPVAATVLDISQNGALLLASSPIPRGEWVLIRPDNRGVGYGTEIVAVVEQNLSPNEPAARLVCRFPEPIEYHVLRLFY